MPRKTPMPIEERLICRRLREARDRTGLSRVAFARQIGIDATLLANYELAKVRVPFRVAFRAAHCALVNILWIATGGPVESMEVAFPDILEDLVPARALLSDVASRVLSGKVAFAVLDPSSNLQTLPGAPLHWIVLVDQKSHIYLPPGYSHWAQELIERGKKLPEPVRTGFFEEVAKIAEQFLKKHEHTRLTAKQQSVMQAQIDRAAEYVRERLSENVSKNKKQP